MCIQTGMLKRLMFPRFLALERLFLKIRQDYAARDARASSELTICPCDQLAGAGRVTYRLFFSHWKSRVVVFYYINYSNGKLVNSLALCIQQHFPDIANNPEADSCLCRLYISTSIFLHHCL